MAIPLDMRAGGGGCTDSSWRTRSRRIFKNNAQWWRKLAPSKGEHENELLVIF
jgi:hypothetical protein